MPITRTNNLSQFPADDHLTPIAIAARQEEYIADGVFPRLQPSQVKKFTWLRRKINNALGGKTSTHITRRGEPRMVDHEGEEIEDKTEDYGVQTVVSDDDQHQAGSKGLDPRADATEGLMEIVHTDRERRVAAVVLNSATYPASQVETLAGTDQFSDPASKPIDVVEDLLNSMAYRANTMVIGRNDLSVLRRNPQILKGFHGNEGDAGMASLKYIADLFQLDRILVGVAFNDLDGPEGDLTNIERIWDGGIALLRINPRTSGSRSERLRLTFGATQPYRTPVAFSELLTPGNKGAGLRGSHRVVAGESLKEFVSANFLGALIQNPTAA